ncbi:MAG: ABC transporter ATP-binding protein [Candidatus Nanopelagicaceae bacterium]|nr:ABC transporter ATP-binding protein [Candidatus Nanopelagicaceae bacterium]
MANSKVSQDTGDLVLNRVSKFYGDFCAVDDLSLTVPDGSFFALLGPSGCGKTTTLRMIAGLEEPSQGTIQIGDNDITTQKPYRRNVNTVFQNYALFPHLTIFENIAFGLRRRGIKDVKTEVENALNLVELGHLAERKPGQLSGGQQQRIAVARAIVNRPEVLLLDEPLGALDLKLRRQMQIELKRIQMEVGITFIHVTHDQEEAMTMADTIAVMNQGKIEQMGSATELYEAPKTAFVANFLGQCNLIKAKVQSRAGGKAVVTAKGHTFEVPLSRVSTDSDSVLLGVRPEKLRLDDRGVNSIKDCVVTDRSFVGTSTQYLVRTPWDLELVVFEQNDEGLHDLHVGDKVSLEWDAEHTFALDGAQDINAGADLEDEE